MKRISFLFKRVLTIFCIRLRRYLSPSILLFRSSYFRFSNTHSVDFPFFSYSQFVPIPFCILSNYSSNIFDVFGSGWSSYVLPTRHTLRYLVFRYLWLPFSLRSSKYRILLYSLIPIDYTYINWSVDIVSGYSWSPFVPSVNISWIISNKSIDIKYPWELSRLHHLPQIAVSLTSQQLWLNRDIFHPLFTVIRNQLLDFIVSNPKDFGVNWSCPMDVAIRSSNICLTLAILPKSFFDNDHLFFNVVLSSLNDHFLFLCRNLEFSPSSNNHYLSNLCGLLFTSIHLPESVKTNNAILFATLELHFEFDRQFLDDGGNFEGSSGYHRLSLDMVLYSSAALIGLDKDRLMRIFSVSPDLSQFSSVYYFAIKYDIQILLNLRDRLSNAFPPLSNSFIQKLHNATAFLQSISLPNGLFPLIGDFDSGRFFKLDPIYTDPNYLYTNSDLVSIPDSSLSSELSCSSLDTLAAASALGLVDSSFHNNIDFSQFNSFKVVSLLSNHSLLNNDLVGKLPFSRTSPCAVVNCSSPDLSYFTREFNVSYDYEIPAPNSITFLRYPFFGLYIWRSPMFFLSIRCLTSIQDNNISHFHDDQLSLNLIINGISHILDPGSPTYGRSSSCRNLYRSSCVHLPFPLDPLDDDLPPFKSLNLFPASILSSGRDHFHAIHHTKSYFHSLSVEFSGSSLSISRSMNASESIIHKDPSVQSTVSFSPAYGVLLN